MTLLLTLLLAASTSFSETGTTTVEAVPAILTSTTPVDIHTLTLEYLDTLETLRKVNGRRKDAERLVKKLEAALIGKAEKTDGLIREVNRLNGELRDLESSTWTTIEVILISGGSVLAGVGLGALLVLLSSIGP